jgi:hypothetical protein
VETESSAQPGLVRRVGPWLRRAKAALLVVAALYLLLIGGLSPHHLPGLKMLAFCVLAAALATVFVGSRFWRVETALCLVAVTLGLAGVGDIVLAGRSSGGRSSGPSAKVEPYSASHLK